MSESQAEEHGSNWWRTIRERNWRNKSSSKRGVPAEIILVLRGRSLVLKFARAIWWLDAFDGNHLDRQCSPWKKYRRSEWSEAPLSNVLEIFQINVGRFTRDQLLQLRHGEHIDPFRPNQSLEAVREHLDLILDSSIGAIHRHSMNVNNSRMSCHRQICS